MCDQLKEKLMPEAWINGYILDDTGRFERDFQRRFVSWWYAIDIIDNTDAMGVLCMGGEL